MSDKTTFYAQKIEGEKLKFENPDEYEQFIDNARPGRWTIEAKRTKKKKTPKQCAVIFGLMIKETIVQANEKAIGVDDLLVHLIDGNIPKGQMLTTGFLHELMYTICPTTDENGRRITLSKMNTEQANSLFERYRNILAPIGIVIDDPDPDWNKK